MKLSTETKVGLFFLIGLAILGFITFRVANVSELLKSKVEYKVFFPHASGLNVDDPVAIAGFKVGKIKALALKESGIEMTLAIDPKERIHTDAKATIAWGSLLGGRYIDISIGQSPDYLKSGSVITSGPTIELTEVLFKINEAAQDFQSMLKTTGAGSKIGALLDNVAKASDNIAAITADIRAGRGTAGKIIESTELYDKAIAIADDLKGAAADVRKLLADNDQRLRSIIEKLDPAISEATGAFASVRKLGDEASNGKGPLAALLNDEKMTQDLRNSLSRLSGSLDRLEAVAKNLQEGPGLIARLANDPKLANDVADAVKNIREVTQRLATADSTFTRLTRDHDLYDDIKKLLDDARETLRSVKEQVPVGTFASLLLTSF